MKNADMPAAPVRGRTGAPVNLNGEDPITLLTLVVNNVKFKDGEQVLDESDRNAA